MSALADSRDLYRREFRAVERELPGADLPWLMRRRRQAIEQFMELGFPAVRDEDWKYTDVRTLAQRCLRPAPPAEASTERVAPLALDIRHVLVFVDGRYAPSLSRAGPWPAGVTVSSLAGQLAREPGEVEPWFGRHAQAGRHGFLALNAAFMQDGAVVHIRRDTRIEEPIHLLFVSTGVMDAACHIRNLIVAGAGSRATVIESYAALAPGAGFTNTVTEVTVHDRAALEHYRLEREGEAAWHIGGTYVHQGRDSRYTSHAVALGARLARHELDALLGATGADCELNGLTVTHGRQHIDNHTRIDHLHPHGVSRERYKGVLDGHSRAVFSGRVVVHPGAQRTDAEQSNRNLLLSPDAQADSCPQLEIYADDVKCSHGAATGMLDADQLFYLRARGLDEARARGLLVYAFAADVLARMRLAPVRVPLERQLAGRLPLNLPAEELIA